MRPDEEWQSIADPLAREDQRRYGGQPWDEIPAPTTTEEITE